MEKISAFYWIGTVGVIFTAVLHMVMTLIIMEVPNHSVWWGVYPVFIAFLIIGTIQMYKYRKPTVQ